ncbi:hypothetical protein V6Z12_A01G117900 [Gossypium hirsutum]
MSHYSVSGVRGLHALNEPPPEPPYTVVRVSKTLPFLCRFSGTCKKIRQWQRLDDGSLVALISV